MEALKSLNDRTLRLHVLALGFSLDLIGKRHARSDCQAYFVELPSFELGLLFLQETAQTDFVELVTSV